MGWPNTRKALGPGLDHRAEVSAIECALLLEVRADRVDPLVRRRAVQRCLAREGTRCGVPELVIMGATPTMRAPAPTVQQALGRANQLARARQRMVSEAVDRRLAQAR